jgi:hypothetical protein
VTELGKHDAPDDTFDKHYTIFFVHFVYPRALGGWATGSDPRLDQRIADPDGHLLEIARENGLPLITNECYSPEGIDERTDNSRRRKKLRHRARAAGVQVFTPREFWDGKIDAEAEAEDFLRRFREAAPAYAAAHSRPDIARNSLDALNALYNHVLLGYTASFKERVPVSM